MTVRPFQAPALMLILSLAADARANRQYSVLQGLPGINSTGPFRSLLTSMDGSLSYNAAIEHFRQSLLVSSRIHLDCVGYDGTRGS